MFRTSTKKFSIVFSVIFFAEFIIMYLIGHNREDSLWENLQIMLLDSVSLSLIVAPVLYMVLLRPLEDSLREIKILKGLMSVCCVCKKVNTSNEDSVDENWIDIDKYIQQNSDILFSHGYCPECHSETLKKIEEFKDGKQQRESKGTKNPPRV